jgi:hypothetical protein
MTASRLGRGHMTQALGVALDQRCMFPPSQKPHSWKRAYRLCMKCRPETLTGTHLRSVRLIVSHAALVTHFKPIQRPCTQVLYEISYLLNTQLDRETLTTCVSMIENGVNPEALAVC